MKKVGKYVAITFLLLIGLCCVGVLYLFFIPNSSLFGISYINSNETLKSLNYNLDDVDKINLNSLSYKVNLCATDQSVISADVFSNSFGFVLSKTKIPTITASVKNKVLTFNISEPQGLAASKNSYINLYVPSSKAFDISLKNKNAKTELNSNNLIIDNLTYETKSGDFNFTTGRVNGMLTLNIGKGKFTVASTATMNANPLELSLTSGKFYANYSTLGNVTIKENSRGVISIKECANVKQNSSSSGGQIVINKLQNISLTTGDTLVNLNEVMAGATIDVTKSGSIKIGTIIGSTDIKTNSGDISINNCESIAVLHTDSGNITVNNAKKRISIKTNYGKANVSFAESADSYLNDSTARVLYATIHNGSLNAEGVEHVGITDELNPYTIEGINVTGNGRVNIRMNNVYGQNTIAGKNGSVNLIINDAAKYVLKTSSNSGNVRVNLLQINSYRGYTTRELKTTLVNCSESENSLSVSTGYGDLTILDTKIYEFGF